MIEHKNSTLVINVTMMRERLHKLQTSPTKPALVIFFSSPSFLALHCSPIKVRMDHLLRTINRVERDIRIRE